MGENCGSGAYSDTQTCPGGKEESRQRSEIRRSVNAHGAPRHQDITNCNDPFDLEIAEYPDGDEVAKENTAVEPGKLGRRHRQWDPEKFRYRLDQQSDLAVMRSQG